MLSLVRVLIRPWSEVERIRSKPEWLIPFIILAIAHVAVVTATQHSSVLMTLRHLPPGATIQDKIAVEQLLYDTFGARIAFLPFRLLTGWLAFAITLFTLCKVWKTSQSVRLAHIIALEIHAEVSLLFGSIGAAVLVIFNRSNILSAVLKVPFGLDAFFSSPDDVVLLTFLNSFNLFSAWYVVILTAGIHAFYQISLTKSLVTALAGYGFTALFQAATMFALRDAFHFNI